MIDWSKVGRVHLIGVCGTGMGSFAGMLKAAGHVVTGSDENVYPPMSTALERWGIPVAIGFRPENVLAKRPDLVVIGNAVRRAYAVSQAIAQTVEHAGVAEEAAARGRLYTVFSNKGGVGKSLVATNLGVALADSGLDTCVVDLDVNSGDVAIMLQLNPTRTINDLVGFSGVIDDGAIDSVLTKYSDNLSIVAAPIRLDSPEQATATPSSSPMPARRSATITSATRPTRAFSTSPRPRSR